MSAAFAGRLQKILPDLVKKFGTPFHIYDEKGILETGNRLNRAFKGVKGFREYYAVKALPNPDILKIMSRLGFGFDCSSIIEVELAEETGSGEEDIMFTSNNTSWEEFEVALDAGAIINLDDISLVEKLKLHRGFPKLVCFRINPGATRTGNSIIGKPLEQKYGITLDQLIPAYQLARQYGATRFGIHTMVCSNQRNYRYMVETVRMLLKQVAILEYELGIQCEFMNMGGGIGIPYKPQQRGVDIEEMAQAIKHLMGKFKSARGWVPKLFMESGRFVTGPHGALVSQVINRKEIYQTHVGVDTGMPGLMRHAIYGAYHHITVLDSKGRRCDNRLKEWVNVVGSICENCDRLATQRLLPVTMEGDIIITHDTGAHGIAMGFNYNGRTRPQELLLQANGSVKLIRRAETVEDLYRTLDFRPKVWRPRC